MVELKDNETFISVETFKKKLKEMGIEHNNAMKDRQSEIECKFFEEKDEYRKSINRMKELYISPTVLYATAPYGTFSSQLGIKTEIFVDGFELYTGDEVRVDGGSLGVVSIDKDGSKFVKTNKFNYDIDEGLGDPIMSLRQVHVADLRITKHFNEMIEGDEIAKGRHGGYGFAIKSKENENV